MKILQLSALVLLLASPAAFAEAAPAEQGDGSRIVCFSEPKTGSHMRKRTCMTEAERESRRKADQETLQDGRSMRSSRRSNPSQPSAER